MAQIGNGGPEHNRDFMRAPQGRCLVCGAPLGEERHWITRYPHGEHDRCRDWSAQPFPYDKELARLRVIARGLRDQYVAVVAMGKFLRDARAAWPRRTRSTLEQFARRRKKLQRTLRELRDRLVL